MNDDDKGFMAGIFIMFLVSCLIWNLFLRNANDSWRQQIADHGCAEYYLDQNHDRQWKWKDYDKTTK